MKSLFRGIIRLRNSAPVIEAPGQLHFNAPISPEVTGSGPARVKLQAYDGGPVSQKDAGIPYPVYYDVPSMTFLNSATLKVEHFAKIGHVENPTKPENRKIDAEGVLSLDEQETALFRNSVKSKYREASICVDVQDWDNNHTVIPRGQTSTINNRNVQGPAVFIYNSNLVEISICEEGRANTTSVTFLNSEQMMRLFNSAEPKGGNAPPATPTIPPQEAQPTPVAAPVTTLTNSNTPNTPPQNQTVTLTNGNPTGSQSSSGLSGHEFNLAVQRTTAQTMRLCNAFPTKQDKIFKMLDEGKDFGHIENTLKYESMEERLTDNIPGMAPPKQDALSVRFMMSVGATPEFLKKKKFDERQIDAANDQPRMGFDEMLYHVARLNGLSVDAFNPDNTLKQLRNSNFGVFDMPNLFERTGDIMIDQRWEINPPFATQICLEASNQNFQPTQHVRPESGKMWKRVAEDNRIDLVGAGKENFYQTELDTVGQMMTISRKMAINGNPEVIQELFNAMVEGAWMVPDYKFGVLLLKQASAPGTFWVDGDNSEDNFALTDTNLQDAYNRVGGYTQTKDTIDWLVDLEDEWYVIGGRSMERTAWELFRQSQFVGGGTREGRDNYWFGKMDFKKFSNYTNQSAFGGAGNFASTSGWTLWPRNNKYAPMVITYLRGRKKPVTEQVPLENSVLGFGWRGFWDVEISLRERMSVFRAQSGATPSVLSVPEIPLINGQPDMRVGLSEAAKDGVVTAGENK